MQEDVDRISGRRSLPLLRVAAPEPARVVCGPSMQCFLTIGGSYNKRGRTMRPISFVVALAAVFGVTAAQADEFRSSDLRAANNPSVQAVNYMGKLVRE